MANRTAKFASAIFASLLAGISFATVSLAATGAGVDCLSEPKGETPEGRHWYYRIEHPTQRHCWYLRDEEKLSEGTPQNLLPPAKSDSPRKAAAAAQSSIADARAELPPPQARVEQASSAATAQRTAATTADAASIENNPGVNAGFANTRPSPVAARWPGQDEVSSLVNSQPTAASIPASVPSNSKAPPPAAVTAVTFTTADSSSKGRFGSIPMLLTVAMGALSLAAVVGSAIFGFGTQWAGQPEIRNPRRVNWGSNHQGSEGRMRRVDVPRDPRAADDPNRRIAEMLARLSRHAVT